MTLPGKNVNPKPLIVETFPAGPLQCNCTIIGDPVTREATVVDPGGNAQYILDRLKHHNLKVTRILHTHAHFDHVLAAGDIHQHHPEAPICLHQDDWFLWKILDQQCQMFGILYEPVPKPHQWLQDEEPLAVGGFQGKALHTPGHSPGSMCFVYDDAELILSGDTLFRRGIGRTDLWGGDDRKIMDSLKNRILKLNDTYAVVPGHGASTTLDYEREHNPFL